MKIQNVINIEDDAMKNCDITKALKKYGVKEVKWAATAELGIMEIELAIAAGQPYDILVLDMHFDFYGEIDNQAGEKTLNLLREKGIEIPVIMCSSQNWNIQGTVACILYNDKRDWESDMKRALDKV